MSFQCMCGDNGGGGKVQMHKRDVVSINPLDSSKSYSSSSKNSCVVPC